MISKYFFVHQLKTTKRMSLVTHHDVVREDVEIQTFEGEYACDDRTIDKWQRLDGWTFEFKMVFIRAILCGSDIPKIMEYTLLGDPMNKKRILDGGHRCRAIHEFKRGDFGVDLLDGNCYWWEHDESRVRENGRGQNRQLPQEHKQSFDSYKLSVTTYLNITDSEARVKFNELNHCSPMAVQEVINSWCSNLIDFMRSEWAHFINDPNNCEYKDLQRMFCLKNGGIAKLMHMKVITGLFSIIHRSGETDEYSYCEPGAALRYVKANFGELTFTTQFTLTDIQNVEWPKFTDALKKYYMTMDRLNAKCVSLHTNGPMAQFKLVNHSEALSYFGYINNHMGTIGEPELAMFIDFHEKCQLYRKESTKIDKKLNVVKDPESFTQLQLEYSELEESVGESPIKWLSSFKTNGSGPNNLLKRRVILDTVFGH